MKAYNLLIMFNIMIFPVSSFAFFCPNNFNQIDYGMTTAQITTQCGKPDTQKTINKENDNVPQEWTYYVPQSVALSDSAQGNGTLKTSIAFDSTGKAINISVNGIGVGSTTVCGNTVSLGDSRDTVQSACGKPSFNNMQNNESGGATSTKETDFVYNSNPPATLVFVNGVLSSKQ